MAIKTRTFSNSEKANEALELVEFLQSRFVCALESLGKMGFERTEWFRDEGLHGGGVRYGISDSPLLGRASVNVSQVQYEDEVGAKP